MRPRGVVQHLVAASAFLALFLTAIAAPAQEFLLPPQPEDALNGLQSITTDHYGSKVQSALDTINAGATGTALSVTVSSEGEYSLSGMVGGFLLQPVALQSFEKSSGEPWAYADLDNGLIQIKEQVLAIPPDAIAAEMLLHEALHHALGLAFPDFEKQCPDCAHKVVSSETSKLLCAIASKCPPPGGMSESGRKEYAAQADSEIGICQSVECDGCRAMPRSLSPECPDPCKPPKCR